ncbi:MAG: GNAT family N-acetyltransferase, partial [Solobacterium sp.]|nr:GNAT family N-acetyltransferase [Solobacterium sp.]
MLEIRELNWQDADAIYQVLKELPADENGFMNPYYGIDKETFMHETMPKLIDTANGINLKPGYVPQTYYFLWEDNHIVGIYKLRHYLNENLRNGSGHIGYGILPAYRNQGYAKKGLALLLDIAKDVIREDEIYMASHKDNPASLHVQLANGAYIHHDDEEEVYTRLPIKPIHACIWDLDGTLLDSYDVILDSLQETMKHYGHTYDREYLRKYVILHSVHQFILEFAEKEGLQFEMVYQYYTTLQ